MSCAIRAEVAHIAPARESPLYATVELRLTNDGARPCGVERYSIRWEGGEAEYAPPDLIVPAHTTVTRTVRVMPATGDVSALLRDPAGASVAVLATHVA